MKNLFERVKIQKRYNEKIATVIDQYTDLLTCDPIEDPYTTQELISSFEKYRNCGSILEIRSGESGDRIHNGNYCKQPSVCSVCSGRVESRRQAVFSEDNKEYAYKHKMSIHEATRRFKYAYMVTATVIDDTVLKDGLNRLNDSLRSFVRKGQKRGGKRSLGEWGKVRAAISNIEIKRGKKSGLWHPHFHAIVFTDEQLDYKIYDDEIKKSIIEQAKKENRVPGKDEFKPAIKNFINDMPVSKISSEWFKSSHGSINIDVTPVVRMPVSKPYHSKAEKKRINHIRSKVMQGNLSLADSVYMQCNEIFKYNAKFNYDRLRSHPQETVLDWKEIKCATANRRLFRTYGEFRVSNLNPDWEYVDDEGDGEIFLVKWRGGEYQREGVSHKGLFVSSDKKNTAERFLMGESAKIQGEFRRRRSAILKARKGFYNAIKPSAKIAILQIQNWVNTKIEAARHEMQDKINHVWEGYRSWSVYGSQPNTEILV